jgi:glycosyltransferase involved in cell wall biosynthesis
MDEIKIAILTNEGMAYRKSGDWVQAEKTAAAMKGIGANVKHYVYGTGHYQFDLPENITRITVNEIPTDIDVLHFISSPNPHQLRNLIAKPKGLGPLIVGSTIFWRSYIHHRVVYNNGGPLKKFIKAALIDLSSNIITPIRQFESYDLLLPNSQTEINQLKKYCRLKIGAKIIAVPNAIDPIPDWASECPPPLGLIKNDYIVYPGVFMPRKNQIGFIEALRDSNMKVVFMGGPLDEPASTKYYEICRQMAPKQWVFLGHIKHRSPEFYGALGNARVACLASSCETPGIALLESSALGVRPAITQEGGTIEYYGFEGEYLNPLSAISISNAVSRAWNRGRLDEVTSRAISRYTWEDTARMTIRAYQEALSGRNSKSNGSSPSRSH